MAHVRRDRQWHRESLGHEQLVERPAIRKPQIDQRPPVTIALLRVALDTYPQPWAQQPLRERRRLTPEALLPAKDLCAPLSTTLETELVRHRGSKMSQIAVPFDVDPSVVGRLKAVLAASGAGADARLIGVRSRWSELEAAQSSLDDRLDGLLAARQVETGLDPKRNAVVVETANDLTGEEAALVQAALDRTSVTAQRRPVQASVLGGVPDDCGWTSDPKDHYYCSNPLRGGPNIFPPAGTSAGCSSGFITRGNDANNYPFILTAGHCLENESGTWSSKGWPGLLIHSIGSRWSWTASSEGDWGLIRLTNSFWRVGPYVFVSTSPDTPNRNDAYRILRSGDAGRGAFICVSSGIRMGNGYFTDCGEVEMLNVEAGGVQGLSRMTSVCGVDGSSGGPYFKYNRAYGIHWGRSSSLHCVSYHQPVQEAMSKSNVHLEP
jgi:hypothetical protein